MTIEELNKMEFSSSTTMDSSSSSGYIFLNSDPTLRNSEDNMNLLESSVNAQCVAELEDLILNHESNHLNMCQELETLTKKIHASYLLLPLFRESLQRICIMLTGSSDSPLICGWKDLASAIGLDLYTIGCIENLKADPTEVVLKIYCLREDASLAVIVSTLYKLKRYDALNLVSNCFPAVVKFAKEEHKISDEKQLSCSESIEKDSLEKKKLLNPVVPLLKDEAILKNLPKALISSKVNPEILETNLKISPENIRELVTTLAQERLQQSTSSTRKSKPKKKVFLLFAEDGKALAKEATKYFRAHQIGVLVLSEHMARVMENAEHFVMHQIQKMDFVIPIVTEGYLCELGKPPDLYSSDVDTKYIGFVHDIVTKEYRANGYKNYRVRTVIPTECKEVILNHSHFKIDPILKVYFCYNKIDMLIDMILRKNHCKMHCSRINTQ